MMGFVQVARNTLRESQREPLCLIVTLCALSLVGLLPPLALFVFREEFKIITDNALMTLLSSSMVLAALLASLGLGRELRSGTAALVLSKPVSPAAWLLAKMSGTALAVLGHSLVVALGALVVLRATPDQFELEWGLYWTYWGLIVAACAWGAWRNWSSGVSFSSSTQSALLVLLALLALAAHFWPAAEGSSAGLHHGFAACLVAVLFAAPVMSAAATAASIRLGTGAVLGFCASLLLLGLAQRGLLHYAGDPAWGAVVRALIPDWQAFWLADPLASGIPIPASYLFQLGLYSAVQTAAWCLVGCLLALRAETGAARQ
ncbi:MAG: hypothetical protein RL095_653 [Verrucomicrobiota bacterium]|jgi:ABC-type transport system involved in multi-copper enzyme maturation permease subunit